MKVIIGTYVGYFAFERAQKYIKLVLRRNKYACTVGAENNTKFIYLGLNIHQYENLSISIDQISYNNSINFIETYAENKLKKEDLCNDI